MSGAGQPITQAKVAGLEPRWSRFPGFSLLFDNPASAWTGFYSRLHEAMLQLAPEVTVDAHAFCPLPFDSYHVTVWDGVNAANLGALRAEREAWTAFLAALPGSATAEPASIGVVRNSALATQPCGPIRFTFLDLQNWFDEALVARLQPDGEDSAQRFARLVDARRALAAEAQHTLGMSPRERFQPHVTLGYFANGDGGARAREAHPAWQAQFAAALEGATLEFTSIGLYTFADMAAFQRR